jgi:hypothetical protein
MFFCLLLFEGTVTTFLVCLVIEGSGAGSRRPKNIRIRRIWIHNNVFYYSFRPQRISINLLHIQDTDWRQICCRSLRVHYAMDPAYQ